MSQLLIQTRVLPGHRIEVATPNLSEGTMVDVTIVPRAPASEITAVELLKMPLEERDRILQKAAEEMREYYESTADERIEWQGGDILE